MIYTSDSRDVAGLRFTREGRNGTRYYLDTTCPKCGGAGVLRAYAHVEGGVCFLCGGTGYYETEIALHTPEHAAALVARREAKARREAAAVNQECLAREGVDASGRAWLVLGDTYAIKDDLKAAGARYAPALGWYFAAPCAAYPCAEFNLLPYFEYDAYGRVYGYDAAAVSETVKALRDEYAAAHALPSAYIGAVGDRLELDLTCTGAIAFESFYGGGGVSFLNFFADAVGNQLIWSTVRRVPEGAVRLRGTIKEHKEYKGVKQTVLTRCKVLTGE